MNMIDRYPLFIVDKLSTLLCQKKTVFPLRPLQPVYILANLNHLEAGSFPALTVLPVMSHTYPDLWKQGGTIHTETGFLLVYPDMQFPCAMDNVAQLSCPSLVILTFCISNIFSLS